MNTIACCYLTYNHPEVIDQVLGFIAEPYTKHGIDIYVYDSSESDDTKNIVEKYMALELYNIFYIDVKHIDDGNIKLYEVLQGKYLPKHYDYIWPTKDRCFFTGRTLDLIVEEVQAGYDIVFAVNENDRWELRNPPVKDVYTDPVEFFSHYGQLSTNWEAMIRKTETMVDGVDWDDLTVRYKLGTNNFNQPVSAFAILAQLKEPRVRVIHHDPVDKKYSALAHSEWTSAVVVVWIERWIPAIFSLPSIYDAYKLPIIQSELGLNALFGANDAIIHFKNKGYLTKEKYMELRSSWNIISPISIEIVDMIMNDQMKEFFNRIARDFVMALANKDYESAFYLFKQNSWLKSTMSEDNYEDLKICFEVYKSEINEHGTSILFNGVSSIQSLLSRYYEITGKKLEV